MTTTGAGPGCTIDVPHGGRGHGARAQGLLADHLFAATPTRRVGADTDAGNVAPPRPLGRAGLTPEAVRRSAPHRGGAWHDLVMHGRARGDA